MLPLGLGVAFLVEGGGGGLSLRSPDSIRSPLAPGSVACSRKAVRWSPANKLAVHPKHIASVSAHSHGSGGRFVRQFRLLAECKTCVHVVARGIAKADPASLAKGSQNLVWFLALAGYSAEQNHEEEGSKLGPLLIQLY